MAGERRFQGWCVDVGRSVEESPVECLIRLWPVLSQLSRCGTGNVKEP